MADVVNYTSTYICNHWNEAWSDSCGDKKS